VTPREALWNLWVHIDSHDAEIKRLREALRFYANEDNYYTKSLMLRKSPEDEHPPIRNDKGAIARAALDWEEEEEE